jgi:hypothetical protein
MRRPTLTLVLLIGLVMLQYGPVTVTITLAMSK